LIFFIISPSNRNKSLFISVTPKYCALNC
jgi:uncharacterized radical SAM superfamily protein